MGFEFPKTKDTFNVESQSVKYKGSFAWCSVENDIYLTNYSILSTMNHFCIMYYSVDTVYRLQRKLIDFIPGFQTPLILIRISTSQVRGQVTQNKCEVESMRKSCPGTLSVYRY